MEITIIKYLDWNDDEELLEVELPDGRHCGALVNAYGEELFTDGLPLTLEEAHGMDWHTAKEVIDG